ncbi:hypothetical protein [Pseudomonas sp. TCU-HL1]|uniref:hypothetical protein n=1 Tax=Pseudomonas sp. TCU-HL1 TaxID=1856685 RepID=UPI0011AB321C|nr:hypothetical protein [Pseudomonas sp. TCU-HL1]
MMHAIHIDETGYINNPCLINKPELSCQKAWGALVFRRGKKIKIASFLPRENNGKKIGISGIPRGVYLEFCAKTENGKTRSLYVVDQVTESEISLLPVVDAAVPSIYDVDSMTPTRTYILEAKLTMMEAQLDDLRRSILDMKGATS